ncbi:MAG: alpha/beta hydrolase [Gemmataceae bacterium]|nr:alpha/beta hydrolase [Gemmata sp.]MDW8199374.1 alpha/beta hydrolase [Gemmataceae bacterium]
MERRIWLRRGGGAVLFILLTYLVIITVLGFVERFLVFHPLSADQAWLPPADAQTQEVTFPSVDGTPLVAWWLPPRQPSAGAILYAHGNGGNITHRGKVAAQLRQELGAGVLLFDYPGYGKCPGTPTEAGCYAAAGGAYRWLLDVANIAPERVIVYGESLGGGPAVELARRVEHRALVLVFCFTSLPAVAKDHYPFLPTFTLMRMRFDNLAKMPQCRRPVFITHGTDDRVVPFYHAEQLYAAAPEPKFLLPLEGQGHDLMVVNLYLPVLADFLARHAP